MLPNWWSPPGPKSESAPGPEAESEAGSGLKSGYLSLRKCLGFRCRRVARTHAAALLAFVMGEALGFRPAPGTPSGTRSVGTRRAVRVVCMPSEGTARAAQLSASAVTASAVGGSATGSVVAESLRRRAARRGARAIDYSHFNPITLTSKLGNVGRLVICITVVVYIQSGANLRISIYECK